ncbi:WD40-repeat-containing domain protein [Schizophyllum commune]
MANTHAGTSKGCLPNTRVQLLASVMDWVFDPKSPRCLILHGAAGKGKSAIANSVARILADMGAITPFFAFDRTIPSRHAHQLYPTLAEHLARYDQSYLDVLRRLPSTNLRTTDIQDQLQMLMIPALRHCSDRVPIVLVVDALDECPEFGGEGNAHVHDRSHLLETLRVCISDDQLSDNIRFFVTARPDSDIIASLSKNNTVLQSIDNAAGTEVDIRRFVEAKLANYWDYITGYEQEREWPPGETLVIEAGGLVNSIAYSPDGTKIVAGLWDGTLRLWDAEMGRQVGDAIRGHTDWVLSVAFSPDGSRIASGSRDHTARLWDAKTSQQQGEALRGHTDWVQSVSFSPDGVTVVSGSYDRTLRLWNAQTGKEMGDALKGHTNWVRSVVFSHDGTCVVSGADDHTVRIWVLATRQQLGKPLRHKDRRRRQIWTLPGSTGWVYAVAFSPDSTRIVSGGDDGAVRIWEAASGKQVGDDLRGHTNEVKSVAFSPDGKHVASGSLDGTIRVWDVQEVRKEGGTPVGHIGAITSVTCSSDGKYIVSGSTDKTVRLWDAKTGQPVGYPMTGHDDVVTCVAFSPDSTRVASASYDRAVRVWDVTTGQPVGDALQGHDGRVLCVAFSPNGTRLASGSVDNTLRLWNPVTGQQVCRPLCGQKDWIMAVSFSRDSMSIASCSTDGSVWLWEVHTQLQTHELEGRRGCARSIAWSPTGGFLVSGSYDGIIQIWDTYTGKQMGEPLTGHTGPVQSVSFSPDGRHIMSKSDDLTVRIWNVQTRQQVCVALQGHKDWINSVSLTADGKHIVSGSDDGTIRVWDFRKLPSSENSVDDAIASPTIAHVQASLGEDKGSWLVYDDNGTERPILWTPHHLRHIHRVHSPFHVQFVPPSTPQMHIRLNESFHLDKWPTYTPAPAAEESLEALGREE